MAQTIQPSKQRIDNFGMRSHVGNLNHNEQRNKRRPHGLGVTMQTVFGAQSTAEEVIAGIDLSDRIAVVTGTSAGLGAETARVLAKAGATVIMAARDADKNQRVIDTIEAETPTARLEHVTLDLSDLRSVRAAAEHILANYPQLHILINNAAVMGPSLARTAEGCELQFGTNHIGHFLLTNLLLPALRAGAPARIVNLSSNGHQVCGVDFDDPHFERRPYDKWAGYGQAKSANVLFGVGLTAREQRNGITANAVHPGGIITELGRHLTTDDFDAMMVKWSEAGPIEFKNIPQGAATTVWAAVSPQLEGISGRYFEDCGIADPVEHLSMTGYRPHALDPLAAERLWKLSEEITGLRSSQS